jgi:hypothetical protein
MALDIDGDTLRVVGTAQQAVESGGYEMDAGSRPVLWEMKLLVAEPHAQRETATVQPTASAASEATSDDRKVEKLASDLAQALIEDDYDAAHGLLAPWLQRQATATQLRSIVKKEFFADLPPIDFVVSGNDSTLAELREHYAEYHKSDATRTLTTAESFGDWGPPSIYVADEITPANFRQWLSIDLTPEPDNEFGLDFILRLWLIAVDVDGTMKVGHLEPGE